MKSARAKIHEYPQLLSDIRSLLDKGRGRAYQAIDNIRVQTYWQVGERIVREELKHKHRADYGKMIVEKLAHDLEFSRSLMFQIVQFYKTYQIVQTVSGQLAWSHFVTLIDIKSPQKRKFYEVQIIKNDWSVRELRKRIQDREYEKARKSGKIDLFLPKQLPKPEQIFKDTYNIDFLQLKENFTEKDLEISLVQNIRSTLLELGRNFCFLGEQVKILVARQYHWIDLLFYHRELQCLIAVELKKEKFNDAHVGQMNTYLTYLREHEKFAWERNPIGLIICEERDKEEVHYALGELEEKIFVAEYKTKLPSEREIQKQLRARR